MYANNLQGFDAIGAAMASVHNDLGLVGEEADKVTASFLDAVKAAADAGLKTMPTLFNRWHDDKWDYGGQYTEDLHRNWGPKLEYVRALVKPLAEDPSVLIWDLCNEPQAQDLNDATAKKEFAWLKDVAEAVRASMSVIGVFEPAQVAGRFLIDGGSVNPVPTQLLADKGISIILASNVIPSLEDRIHRRELKREGKLPNVIGIVSGAMEIMESEIIKSRMGPVDILISPDIARYGTMEYDKANEIIKRGEEAARAQIPAIRQRLAPNPRKRTGG
jgi:predicted acylesterase/phospholipase RssA